MELEREAWLIRNVQRSLLFTYSEDKNRPCLRSNVMSPIKLRTLNDMVLARLRTLSAMVLAQIL